MRWMGKGWTWTAPVAAMAIVAVAGAAEAQTAWPARQIVETPTAGLIQPGAFEARAQVFPGGGVALELDVGLAHWLSVGGSYGGLQIIGDGEPDWYGQPGFAVKARVLEETWTTPALALGVDTQGSGYWDDARERYQYKSRGFYAVLSKNYQWLGDFSVHGGVNRSLEDADDKDPTLFVGLEKSLGSLFGVSVEYDVATNDDRDDGAYGKGRGYLNGLLRWSVDPRMEIRLVVRDMLDNSEAVDPRVSDVVVDEGWGREFSFSYVETF